jgi:hypothetical protein
MLNNSGTNSPERGKYISPVPAGLGGNNQKPISALKGRYKNSCMTITKKQKKIVIL